MESGFIRHPDKRPSLFRNLRNFFQRAYPTEQELRTLHGVVTAFMGARAGRSGATATTRRSEAPQNDSPEASNRVQFGPCGCSTIP